MKRKKLYQILPIFMIGICVFGMLTVGTRIVAKKILIGKLGIENYVTCMLADYNLGDRLERTFVVKNENEVKPERLIFLEEILQNAPEEDPREEESIEKESIINKIKNKVFTVEEDIKKYCNEKFLFYQDMRKLSNSFDRVIGWELVYARKEGTVYALNTGFDYQAVAASEEETYIEKLLNEAQVAKEADVPFLYVQYPYRVDKENSQVPWGASSYENENADAVLNALKKAEVNTLDLREELVSIGWNANEGFYETDGHWTTRSGFLSAGILANHLNKEYGFAFEQKYFDEENYDVRSYDLNSYMVKEEVELFLPEFETQFTVFDAYRDEHYIGDFEEACFDMAKAETKEYSSVLTAYSASRIRNSYLFEYLNELEVSNEKTILVCSNSFCWHLVPYLAMDTAVVDYVYNITPEQMEYYIETLNPDMIIVLDRP